jgi:hypothetical protein
MGFTWAQPAFGPRTKPGFNFGLNSQERPNSLPTPSEPCYNVYFAMFYAMAIITFIRGPAAQSM